MRKIDSTGNLSIGIVSGILHQRFGGPSTVVQAHIEGLSLQAQVEVYGVAHSDEFSELMNKFPRAHVFKKSFPSRWFRARGLKNALFEAVEHLDIMHAHMLWDYPVYAAWRATKKARKPLIITPHGSLSAPWRYRGLHKRIYQTLFLDRILKETACIHVLNKDEETACREFGIDCPIRVIPNALPRAEFARQREGTLAYERWRQLRDKRLLLYMGRLWSEKGLDILPEAWLETLQNSKAAHDWIMVLAGPDYRNYKADLLARIDVLGLRDHILVIEPVAGALKDALFGAADCFVLPSRSEGFSMVLLEAIAAGLPVIYTSECHFPELSSCGGGWEISLRVDDLVNVLNEIAAKSPDDLRKIGAKGRLLGLERYTLENIVPDIIDMYQMALNN